MARRRREGTPWLRNGLKLVFTPPAGRSPARKVAFVFGRLAFFAGMTLFAFTASYELLGPGFTNLAGGVGFWAMILGLFGMLVGVIVGVLVPFMEGFGLYLASLEEHWGARQLMRLVWAICFAVTLSGQLYLVSHIGERDRERLEEAETMAQQHLDRGAAIVNTTVLDRQLEDAGDAVRRAQVEYDRATEWRDTALACPDAGVCQAVVPIQRALGVRDDGIVRSAGAAACATCGETMTAITAEVERTRGRLEAAETERTRINGLLQARLDAQAGGDVTNAVSDAYEAREVKTITDSFMAMVRLYYRVQSLVAQERNPALDNDELLKARATGFTDTAFIVLLCIINVLSASLNNTGYNTEDEDEEGEEPAAKLLSAPEPIGPLGSPPARSLGAEAPQWRQPSPTQASWPSATSPPAPAATRAAPPAEPRGNNEALSADASIARLGALTRRLRGV